MNNKICIDKRVGYLLIFTVPILMVLGISIFVNSQNVSQNSRAADIQPTGIINTASPVEDKVVCLNPQLGVTGIINLFIPTGEGFQQGKPLPIYVLEGDTLTLLTLSEIPADISQKPIATVQTKLFTNKSAYRFLLVQGDSSQKAQWTATAKDCQPYNN